MIGVADPNVDRGGRVDADLDTLLIALYVELEDRIIPAHQAGKRRGPGRPPVVTDAELVCLAVAQVLLRSPAAAAKRVQPAAQERGIADGSSPAVAGRTHPGVGRATTADGRHSHRLRPSPIPPPASQSGVCRVCSRSPRSLRLPARQPPNPDSTVVTDKGLSGTETEQLFTDLDLLLVPPARRDERTPRYFPNWLRQRIEAIIWTLKSQLGLERHNARVPAGLWTRIVQRLLALNDVIWHNWTIDAPVRIGTTDQQQISGQRPGLRRCRRATMDRGLVSVSLAESRR